jgi:iron complex transport system ATP-binding protein
VGDPDPQGRHAAAVRLRGVSLSRDGSPVLRDVDWTVGPKERWAVVGPNGSGKTTLLAIAGGRLHPSRGEVAVLGQRLGASDWRALRTRVGFVSGALTRSLRPALAARDVVMTGKHGALEPWWHPYDDADRARADGLLAAGGVASVADRPFGVISEGERQQVLLARMLMAEPELLLLDEPAAGLDLANRERLVRRLAELAADPSTPAMVLVTHHLEEIPPGTTHALALSDGAVVAAGPVGEVLADDVVSRTFGLPVAVRRSAGRWSAHAL